MGINNLISVSGFTFLPPTGLSGVEKHEDGGLSGMKARYAAK
jgi:hypothetical protein